MSTDWTTKENSKFGNEEVFLKMSNTLASIGLIEIDNYNTVDNVRKNIYNLYKSYDACKGNGNWLLFDSYQESNHYDENAINEIIILSSSVDVNNEHNNVLFSKDNSKEKIEERRCLIKSKLDNLASSGLCDEMLLTGFYPHLDTVTSVDIHSDNAYVPCHELGEDRLYALISYTSSCQSDDDPNKLLEVVPFNDTIEFQRNTMYNPAPSATYNWKLGKNADQLAISDLNQSSITCSMKFDSTLLSAEISLDYSEL